MENYGEIGQCGGEIKNGFIILQTQHYGEILFEDDVAGNERKQNVFLYQHFWPCHRIYLLPIDSILHLSRNQL